MADLTIGDLIAEHPLLATPAVDDSLALWDESAAATKGVTIAEVSDAAQEIIVPDAIPTGNLPMKSSGGPLEDSGVTAATLISQITDLYASKEDAGNKSTTISLGTSDTLYPTQKAVKTYVDSGLAAKQASLGFTAEDSANKSTSTALGTSDTLYPTQKAVKTYVDAATSGGGGVAHVGYEAMMLSQCGDVLAAAQIAYYQTMFANTPVVFNRMTGLCLEYTGSANVLELGIYDAAGAKIDSGTVSLGAAGFFTCNMSGDVTLTPGTKYILALLNRANDTTKKFAAFDPYPANVLLNSRETSRTTLPGTANLTTSSGFAFYLSLWHS